MPVTDARVGPGTLTFGSSPLDFSCQISSAALVPDNEEGEVTPTLCEPKPVAPVTTTWTLEGSVVQDFTDPAGFQKYCFDNNNTQQPFAYAPNTDAGTPTFTGVCLITAIQIGGEVTEQVQVDFSFQVKDDPIWTTTRAIPKDADK